MATTVIQAFNEFLKDTVNLDPEVTTKANGSRDWLVDQIANFKSKDSYFPTSYVDININFGSFARKTKIRELDDIDIMIGLSGQGSTYMAYSEKIEITVSSEATDLLKLCHTNSTSLNSKKVVNKFVSACSNVPQYNSAEIKRNQEAAILNLSSYSWSFDIVPCFITSEDFLGKTYYLIPDGNGYWKKTDPRIDKERTTRINQNHDGNVLRVIRIFKYWNGRATMPSMSSYLLETMILNYYEGKTLKASQFVDVEFPDVIAYIHNHIMGAVDDPKGLQGNINSLTYDEKIKIQNKAATDYNVAIAAREFENNKDMKSSIGKWGEIFGSEFPKYY
jgi:predicted nucleotidyltransferase